MSIYTDNLHAKVNKELLIEARHNGWQIPKSITDLERVCPNCKTLHNDVRLKELFLAVDWEPTLCVDCEIEYQELIIDNRSARVSAKRIEKADLPVRNKDADFKKLNTNLRKKLLSYNLKNGLWVIGDYQVGKSWASIAFLKHLAKTKCIRFFHFPSLIKAEMESSLGLYEFIREFKGVILLDDVTDIKGDYWKSRLEDIITTRFDNMLPIIFTTNIPEIELSAALGERVYFRIVKSDAILNFKEEYHYEG